MEIGVIERERGRDEGMKGHSKDGCTATVEVVRSESFHDLAARVPGPS